MSRLNASTAVLVVLSIWIFAAVALAQSAECTSPLADRADAEKIEPSQVETACRLALRSDPSNTGIMVQLGRALSGQNKAREAMTFYWEAALRRNVDAMNE